MRVSAAIFLGVFLALPCAAFAQNQPPAPPPPPPFMGDALGHCFTYFMTLLKDKDIASIAEKYPLMSCDCVTDGIKADPKLAKLATLDQSELDSALTSSTLRIYAKVKVMSIRQICEAKTIDRWLEKHDLE